MLCIVYNFASQPPSLFPFFFFLFLPFLFTTVIDKISSTVGKGMNYQLWNFDGLYYTSDLSGAKTYSNCSLMLTFVLTAISFFFFFYGGGGGGGYFYLPFFDTLFCLTVRFFLFYFFKHFE